MKLQWNAYEVLVFLTKIIFSHEIWKLLKCIEQLNWIDGFGKLIVFILRHKHRTLSFIFRQCKKPTKFKKWKM